MNSSKLYYIKQDNTIWGCGEPGCCGEYQEEIDFLFVNCDHEITESEMNADHLQACAGGGEILAWRKAKAKEVLAYDGGLGEGYSEGWIAGAEWQEKKAIDEANRRYKPLQEYTVHELIHQGYKITVDGSMIDKPVSVHYEEKLGGK
jgi:hypothetical protein